LQARAVLSIGSGSWSRWQTQLGKAPEQASGGEVSKYEDYVKLRWRLIPGKGYEYFNYDLIDLGACMRYTCPRCKLCPLKDLCVTYSEPGIWVDPRA